MKSEVRDQYRLSGEWSPGPQAEKVVHSTVPGGTISGGPWELLRIMQGICSSSIKRTDSRRHSPPQTSSLYLAGWKLEGALGKGNLDET